MKEELKELVRLQEEIVWLGSMVMCCNVVICSIFGFWAVACFVLMVDSWGNWTAALWSVSSAACAFLFGKEVRKIKDRSQTNKVNKSMLENAKRMLNELEPNE